jgi:hypothetical protein
MVNYIEPNFQEIIFGPIRVGLITQKQFWDHLKNCHGPPNLRLLSMDEQHPSATKYGRAAPWATRQEKMIEWSVSIQ